MRCSGPVRDELPCRGKGSEVVVVSSSSSHLLQMLAVVLALALVGRAQDAERSIGQSRNAIPGGSLDPGYETPEERGLEKTKDGTKDASGKKHWYSPPESWVKTSTNKVKAGQVGGE